MQLASLLTQRVATSTSVGFFNDNESFGLATAARVVTVNGRAFETTWDTVSRTLHTKSLAPWPQDEYEASQWESLPPPSCAGC
ncbi:MAG: hypothetical protein MUC96_05670 [Myxococcaceae bacterium]|nr:hypothetical protein [Myxococcaceae bacterium]